MSDPDASPSADVPVDGTSADDPAARKPSDPVAVAAIVVGCVGIVFFGIVSAIVTAILAAETGRRAREAGRSQENAYFAMALAFIDGVFWLFLHYQFQLPIWAG